MFEMKNKEKLLREELKNYFREKQDIRFNQIVKELNIDKKDIQELKKLLNQLVNEEYIMSSKCLDGEEKRSPSLKSK